MAASSAALHESADQLTPETIDRHRAIVAMAYTKKSEKKGR